MRTDGDYGSRCEENRRGQCPHVLVLGRVGEVRLEMWNCVSSLKRVRFNEEIGKFIVHCIVEIGKFIALKVGEKK